MDKAERRTDTQEKVTVGATMPAPEPVSVIRILRRYLFTGLIVLLPVVVTAFVLWRLFFALDDILGRFVETYIGRPVPGVGLVALVALVMGIGAIASNFAGRRLIGAGETIVRRVPLMGWIYRTTKQLFSVILGERSTSFRKVVLVNYPKEGTYGVAFLTSESPKLVVGQEDKRFVTVFLPTTPNPTSGFLLVVPEEETIPLDMSVDEGLRLVISAGALARSDDES
jgi:uncharacterized membrane protein